MADAPVLDLTARLYVESWSPDYGAPLELSEESTPTAAVDPMVETTDWRPIRGCDRTAPSEVAFVDGVRRIEARMTMDHPMDGPVPGIMGAFGVGAVVWERQIPRSTFGGLTVERMLVMAKGYQVELATMGSLPVTVGSVPGDDPSELASHLQQRMRAAEQSLASRLATPGRLVMADGRIHELGTRPIVGFIKTHQVMYLTGEQRAVVGRLDAGQRTPLFLIDTESFSRYSWYLRLADLPWSHAWTGIVRCEVSTAVGRQTAIELAGWTAALLPGLSSERHIDPRAPQNLVPIAALERELRRCMGDQNLAHRALQTAVYGHRPNRAREA